MVWWLTAQLGAHHVHTNKNGAFYPKRGWTRSPRMYAAANRPDATAQTHHRPALLMTMVKTIGTRGGAISTISAFATNPNSLKGTET